MGPSCSEMTVLTILLLYLEQISFFYCYFHYKTLETPVFMFISCVHNPGTQVHVYTLRMSHVCLCECVDSCLSVSLPNNLFTILSIAPSSADVATNVSWLFTLNHAGTLSTRLPLQLWISLFQLLTASKAEGWRDTDKRHLSRRVTPEPQLWFLSTT